MAITKIVITSDGRYSELPPSHSQLTITANSIKYLYNYFSKLYPEIVEGLYESKIKSDNYSLLYEKLCNLLDEYQKDIKMLVTDVNENAINIYYEDGNKKTISFYLSMYENNMVEIAEVIKQMIPQYENIPSYLIENEEDE